MEEEWRRKIRRKRGEGAISVKAAIAIVALEAEVVA